MYLLIIQDTGYTTDSKTATYGQRGTSTSLSPFVIPSKNTHKAFFSNNGDGHHHERRKVKGEVKIGVTTHLSQGLRPNTVGLGAAVRPESCVLAKETSTNSCEIWVHQNFVQRETGNRGCKNRVAECNRGTDIRCQVQSLVRPLFQGVDVARVAPHQQRNA